jgi:Uma2 family endonuclease
MSVFSHPLTYADLERERESRDERLELIEGEMVVTPAPTPLHQRIAGRLYSLFDQALPEQVYFAPVDVQLTEFTIVQPDIVVVLSGIEENVKASRIEGAPSIVAEIVSPSTSARDTVTKRNLYAQHGVPEYWLVDPLARRVTIYSRPEDGKYQVEQSTEDVAVSATIHGLSAELAKLFAPVPGQQEFS